MQNRNESAPLLGIPNDQASDPSPAKPEPPAARRATRVAFILTAMVFLQVCGEQLMESPRLRLIESILCYKYYERVDLSKILRGRGAVAPGAFDGVAEAWCKIEAVQSELANIGAYQQFLDGMFSLVLAIPFGWLADRRGRRLVLLLGYGSTIARWAWSQFVYWQWQRYSIYWTLLSSLNGLLAGSPAVTGTLTYVIITDITPPSRQTDVFFQVGAASLVPYLITPPLSAWLMQTNPWIPSFGGLLVLCSAFCTLLFIPETGPKRALRSTHGSGSTAPASSPPPPGDQDRPHHISSRTQRPRVRFRGFFRCITLLQARRFLSDNWHSVAAIVPFIGHLLVASTVQLQLQFLSIRFGISIAQATLILAYRAGCSIALYIFIIPRLSAWLMSVWNCDARTKDLYLARASFILQGLGWTSAGVSPTLVIAILSLTVSTFGSGATLFLRGFLSSTVPHEYLATIYSLASMVDMAGAMLGAPLLAALFNHGLDMKEFWLGLPISILGLFSGIFAALLYTIRDKEGSFSRS